MSIVKAMNIRSAIFNQIAWDLIWKQDETLQSNMFNYINFLTPPLQIEKSTVSTLLSQWISVVLQFVHIQSCTVCTYHIYSKR